ncbi:MAG: aminopeptidase [Solirubrobacteraceae bacterium]
MPYTPPPEILERYADLLVNYALGGGSGIRPGDVVRVVGEDDAKPLFAEVVKAVWGAGGHAMQMLRIADSDPSRLNRAFYELGSPAQLSYFPAQYWRGLVDEVNHDIHIMSGGDPRIFDGIDAERLLAKRRAHRPMMEWQDAKENAGRFSWTMAQYATPGLAAEANMSVEEYWEQVIKACFLDDPDPIARWREVEAQLSAHRRRLDALAVRRVHLVGQDLDLRLTIGEKRRWKDAVGINIPSFEIYTTPDWRGTEGWIRFSEPLYAYGSLVKGIRLEFTAGLVTSATADQNQQLLRTLIATEGADRLGEFSLTDARLSPIGRFMANTLFDENAGGPFGNTHVALGQSYKDVYDGDPSLVSDEEWERLGFNESAVHTDIISTTDRTVTAELADGASRVIYAGGRFELDDVVA